MNKKWVFLWCEAHIYPSRLSLYLVSSFILLYWKTKKCVKFVMCTCAIRFVCKTNLRLFFSVSFYMFLNCYCPSSSSKRQDILWMWIEWQYLHFSINYTPHTDHQSLLYIYYHLTIIILMIIFTSLTRVHSVWCMVHTLTHRHLINKYVLQSLCICHKS